MFNVTFTQCAFPVETMPVERRCVWNNRGLCGVPRNQRLSFRRVRSGASNENIIPSVTSMNTDITPWHPVGIRLIKWETLRAPLA